MARVLVRLSPCARMVSVGAGWAAAGEACWLSNVTWASAWPNGESRATARPHGTKVLSMISLSLRANVGAGPAGPAIWQDQLKNGGAREWWAGGARAAIGAAHSGWTLSGTIVA